MFPTHSGTDGSVYILSKRTRLGLPKVTFCSLNSNLWVSALLLVKKIRSCVQKYLEITPIVLTWSQAPVF